MIDKNLLKLIGKNKKYIVIIVILLVLGLLSSITITGSICYALYLLFSGAELIKFVLPLCLLVGCIIIKFVVTTLTGNLRDLLGRQVKKKLRSDVYSKIVSLGAKSVDDMNLSGLTQVSLEGVEQLDLYYSSYIPQFFYAMIAPVVLFLVTVWFDWRVALVLLACVPLIPLSIVAVSKYAKKIFAKYWGKYISMGDAFLDSVQGLKELKIFNADNFQHLKMNEKSEEFRKVTMKVLVMQLASTTIMDAVAYGGAGIGIAMAILGVTAFGVNPFIGLFLILVAVEFFLPLRAFGSAFHIAMNGASAGKKILHILETEEHQWGTKKVESFDLSLKNVTFSYDGKRDVLKNVNMEFKPHSLTALVGESGCGKSTIVSLLMGAYRVSQGQVLSGNTPIEELQKEDYYSHLSVVSYNTYIFNESIRDNFYLASPTASDEEIYRALKEVNLDTFVKENGGLDKVITEDANNISGGQRQRLALAISLLSNKDIYVFDEATSNIDIESEAIIMKNIKNISKDKTVILISHRLANVLYSDSIYYLEDGEIKEHGSHDELLKNNQGYAKLFNTQKELENGYREVTK